MDQLITALGPVFAVGLGLQAFIEWVDGPVIEGWLINRLLQFDLQYNNLAPNEKEQKRREFKSGIVRTVAIVVGVLLAIALDLEVLEAFEQISTDFGLLDNILAGFVISMGTDGINQIVKFVQKTKENQESQAQQRDGGR